jgi:hypothetical protein
VNYTALDVVLLSAFSDKTLLSMVKPRHEIRLHLERSRHIKHPLQAALSNPKKVKINVLFSLTKELKSHILYYIYIFWRRGDLLIRASCWTVATARFGFFLSASNSVPSIIISRPSKRGDLRVLVSGVVTGRISANFAIALWVGASVIICAIRSSAALNRGELRKATWSGVIFTPRFLNSIFFILEISLLSNR